MVFPRRGLLGPRLTADGWLSPAATEHLLLVRHAVELEAFALEGGLDPGAAAAGPRRVNVPGVRCHSWGTYGAMPMMRMDRSPGPGSEPARTGPT